MDRSRAVARVVRAPGVEATDPAFECHSARDFPMGAEAWVCVCVRVVWVPQYGAFRDYSDSLVCVESGQRGRLKFLDDSPMLLGAFKKNNTSFIAYPTPSVITNCKQIMQ